MTLDPKTVAVGNFRILSLTESDLERLIKNNLVFLLQLTEQDWGIVGDCIDHYSGKWDQLLLDKYECTISQLEGSSISATDDIFPHIKEMVLYEKSSGISLISLYPERQNILGTRVDKLRGELENSRKELERVTNEGDHIVLYHMLDDLQRTLIAQCADKYEGVWGDMITNEHKTSLTEFLLLSGRRSAALKMIVEYETQLHVSLPRIYKRIEGVRKRLQE